jgi:hypothetical protein
VSTASTAKGTKIFGMTVKADPKMILGLLAAVLVVAIWYDLHSSPADESPTATAAPVQPGNTEVPNTQLNRGRARTVRRTAATADRGVLRIKPVDASDGRIDPTLRMDLLNRLQSLEPLGAGRSLFESAAQAQMAANAPSIKGPRIPVNMQPQTATMPANVAPAAPVANIPLRYYGFVNPLNKQEGTRGLFMDGDNILVAKEGDQLEGRYLVVALNANNARMEDTRIRQGQILPVTPEANEQQ